MKDDKDRFPKLMAWFDMMNEQFKKVEEAHEKNQLNNLLNDNDIDSI